MVNIATHMYFARAAARLEVGRTAGRQTGREELRRLKTYVVAAAMIGLTQSVSAQTLQEIPIGMSSASLGAGLPRVAKDMGFFAKHGLDPKFVTMDNANVATAAMVSGSINVVLAGPGEMIAAQARGQKVITIASAYRGLAGTLVLSKSVVDKLGVSPTAPIKDRLKALDGLVIAASSATSSAGVAIKGAAAKVGGAEPRFTYIGQPTMPVALESGAIQGFTASAPFWTYPVTKGTAVVWISTPKGELPSEFMPVSTSLLLSTRQFADANPEVITKIQGAFADFSKAVGERPNDVKAQIAKTFPDQSAETIDLFFAGESEGWKVAPLTAADVVKEINFLKVNGINLPQMDTLDPKAMVFP